MGLVFSYARSENGVFFIKHSIENHFLDLRAFLKKNQSLFTREVLNYYPESLADFPSDWTDYLATLSDYDLYRLDGKLEYQQLRYQPFRDFVEKCRNLEKLPKRPTTTSSHPSWAWYGVKGKKRHEIDQMCAAINFLNKEKSFDRITDIGGGVGHLARVLAYYEEYPVDSIDQNRELQAKGEKRKIKYPIPEGAQSLTFHHHSYCPEFYKNQQHKNHLFNSKTCLVGLHTCGALANDLLFNSIESHVPAAISLGCCYLKLDPEKDTNLSQLAKSNSIHLTKYSLTLATRGHQILSQKDFEFKVRVKKYRYLLHLFFKFECEEENFLSVGDSPPSVYQKSFAEFVREKAQVVKIDVSGISNQHIESFYQSQTHQSLFKELFIRDIIRWQLGRILEIDILLDRAIYAKEHGLNVDMFEIFDEKISPRNIALTYTK